MIAELRVWLGFVGVKATLDACLDWRVLSMGWGEGAGSLSVVMIAGFWIGWGDANWIESFNVRLIVTLGLDCNNK